jgi:anaerobic ribonucleoside-triphosphate reductase
MKRKEIRKLSLSRETLRKLEDDNLHNALGGITGTKPCSVCNTCQEACTDTCPIAGC